MRKLTLLILFSFNIHATFAIGGDSIYLKPSSKYFYTKENKEINPRHLYSIVKDVPQSKLEMQNARFNRSVSQTFSFAGGFLFGYGIARMIAYKNPVKIGFLGLGFVCFALSIHFGNSYTKHARHAVHYYNQTIK